MPRTVLDKGKRTELRDRQRPADGPRRLGLLESINEGDTACSTIDSSSDERGIGDRDSCEAKRFSHVVSECVAGWMVLRGGVRDSRTVLRSKRCFETVLGRLAADVDGGWRHGALHLALDGNGRRGHSSSGDVLALRRDVWGFGRTREYDLSHVSSLRVAPAAWNPYDWSGAMQFWGIGGGPVAFDYGSRTFRFGASVDEAEARDIVNQLRAQHSFHGPT